SSRSSSSGLRRAKDAELEAKRERRPGLLSTQRRPLKLAACRSVGFPRSSALRLASRRGLAARGRVRSARVLSRQSERDSFESGPPCLALCSPFACASRTGAGRRPYRGFLDTVGSPV